MNLFFYFVLTSTLLIGSINPYHHNEHEKSENHHHKKVHRRNHLNGDSNRLEFYYNQQTHLIGFLNRTTQIAAIFDYTSSTFLVVNGQNSRGVLVINSQIFELNSAWTASQQNFETFFNSTSKIFGQNNSKQVSNNSIINEAAASLLDSESSSDPIRVFVAISRTFLHLHETTLKGLIRGSGHFKIKGGILRFVIILKGISDLFSEVSGGFTGLAARGISLNLEDVINASNGLQAFLKILEAIGNRVDWSKVIRHVFTDPESFFKIATELSGNDFDNRINIDVQIIYALLAVVRGHGSVDFLIQTLIRVAQNADVEINGSDDIGSVINEFLKLIESQNSVFHNSDGFIAVIRFLRDWNNNNLSISNINISELLAFLRRRDYASAIDMIVRFLLRLNNIFNPVESIPRFFGNLLTSPQLIANLLSGRGVIDPQILQNFNISNLLQNRNFLTNISQIPGISDVYKEISTSLQRASNGSLNLQDLLNNSGFGGILNSLGQGGNLFNTFGGIFGGFVAPFTSFLNTTDIIQNVPSILGGLGPVENLPSVNTSEFTSRVETTSESILSEVLSEKKSKHNKAKHLHRDVKRHLHEKIHGERWKIEKHHEDLHGNREKNVYS